jgi:excinuclease UvrABC ATPase subunit
MPIRIAGARENNLKDVSLEIPKNRISVFVGVSGSGKSSIVFDTVAVEAQRQLQATFPVFVLNFLPKYERPHVDAIENLTTPVIVDQRPLGGNARSTVGTITDVYSLIRAVFARQSHESPLLYSFNAPQGMCAECEGLGRAMRADPDLMLDRTRSLDEGAILLPGYKPGSPGWQVHAGHPDIDPAKPLDRYSKKELHALLHGSGIDVKMTFKNGKSYTIAYEGLLDSFVRRNVKRDVGALSEKTQEAAAKFITEGVCTECGGARLNAAALATRVDGRTIAEWSAMEISDLVALLEPQLADPMIAAVHTALTRIVEIGLGYLSLDRATPSLSGGEGQRLKLVKHLGSDLIGLTYVFDEPSIGLHPRDVGRLNGFLRALCDKGNTVLVVEHDPDVMQVADHVVEIGPRAGAHGGEVVFEGTFAQLKKAKTLTGECLRGSAGLREDVREATGWLPLKDVSTHNLKNVSVDLPAGVLTVVTGVAGSGKSSLIADAFMAAHPEAVFVDQSPIGASSRSTPATYLGILDLVRTLFAKANGVKPALFSFNSEGACEACQGRGVLVTEMSYMDPITTHCDTCDGRRFKESVLAHTLRGKSIADVLEMSAETAAEFFTEKPVRAKLDGLIATGLAYLGLGQALSTLSGGERQRIKLADRLATTGAVYVLDEPTTGLHMSDIGMLLGLLNGLVERGNTVVVIEHNLAVIAHADWIVDLGPDGGKNGGEIIFTGPPQDLLTAEGSLTGQHLRAYLS